MTKDPKIVQAKDDILENLEAIQMILDRCVDEGMIDYESAYYNELSDLVKETHQATLWNELEEVITLAKTLETDIDAWLSVHGRTTVSLIWPNPSCKNEN